MPTPLAPEDAYELGRLFKTHFSELFGYANLLTRGDKALAEDLVQDTFQAAARAWSTVGCLGEERRRVWLRGTLHNKAVTAFRRGDLDRRTQAQVADRYRPAETDVHQAAISAIALERCWQVIDRMPERQHQIAVMRWREQMKEREIAELLGISLGAVSAQLSLARKKLLKQLGPYYPFALDDTTRGTGHDGKEGQHHEQRA